MVKIRLQRKGKKSEAHYRIVVSQSTKARDSKYIADLGYYNPHEKDGGFHINQDSAKEWLKNGAQPSDTVAQFFVKLGLIKKLHKGSKLAKQKGKKKESAKSE